jgi:hypothetical protein
VKIRRLIAYLARAFIVLFLLFFLAAMGMIFVFTVPFTLVFGWIFYLTRVVGEAHFNGAEIFVAAILLSMFGFGLHRGLHWLYRSVRPEADPEAPGWQPRWTASLVGLGCLLFAASVAVIGTIHQLGWIFTSNGPVLQSRSSTPRFRASRLCGAIEGSELSAPELRRALWRDPNLRRRSRGLHVLVREQANGSVLAAIFLRAPGGLESQGLHLCGAEHEEFVLGPLAPAALRENGFIESPAEQPPEPEKLARRGDRVFKLRARR